MTISDPDAKLRAVFPIPYTREVDEALRAPWQHPETTDANERFIGTAWPDVDDGILLAGCPSPFVIAGHAFRYYFPAFLSAGLRHGELMDTLINFTLLPPKRPEKLADYCERYSWLSIEQRKVVADWLRYAKQKYQSTPLGLYTDIGECARRFRRRIDDMLVRYWDRDEPG